LDVGRGKVDSGVQKRPVVDRRPVEFIGTYDVVVNTQIYPLFRIAEDLRWTFLRLKAKLRK
jgi:hypothetical protein